MLSSLKRKFACKHWPGLFLLALLFTVFTPAAHGQQSQQVVAVDCGGFGQRVCNDSDGFYHVVYNVSMDTAVGNFGSFVDQFPPPFWFNESQCDLGLSPNGDICDESSNGKWSGHRNIIGTSLNTPWIDFAMKEQRGGIQSDQAMNWITIFGTHNSFSNYQDGAFDVQIPGVLDVNLNVDQNYSITDQLNAGARIIRMDPITYGAVHNDWTNSSATGIDYELRMCHQSASLQIETDGECDFTSYGRLFADGVFEVRQWLDANPGEVVIIRMDRTLPQDVEAITLALKFNLAPANNPFGNPTDVLMPPVPSDSVITADYAIWDPQTQGWPSLRQMRAMNKRLIILSNLATNFTYPWTWVMNDGYTDAPNFTACYNQPGVQGGVDIRTRPSNMWSYIGEDRSGSNAITATYSPSSDGGVGLLNTVNPITGANDVKTATNCGYGLINVDFLLASQAAPHMSGGCPNVPSSIDLPIVGNKSLPSEFVTLANDMCVPDFDYRTGIDENVNSAGLTGQADSNIPRDVRRESAIWSWDMGDMGTAGPASLKINGRWESLWDGNALQFACAVGQGNIKNPANYQWVVTPTTGTWEQGPQACQAIGGTFWAPQSALENQNLIQVAKQSAPDANVWINYKSQSNVLLEPISPQLEASGDNSFVIDVTQGQSGAALSPIFQYTGGEGGDLTALQGPNLPQLFSKVTVNFPTKNINFAVASGVLDSHGNVLLQPGTYTQNFTVSEVQQVVVDVQTYLGNIPTLQYEPVLQSFTVTVNVKPAPVVSVTVDSNIAGQTMVVDGTPVTAPHTFSWVVGSQHKLDASEVKLPSGVRAQFLSWSDGAVQQAFTYTVPTQNSDIIAKFQLLYRLILSLPVNGTVTASPSGQDGYYDSGTDVKLTATPEANYYLKDFTGDLSGSSNPQTIVMTQPHTVSAMFAAKTAVTIASTPSGMGVLIDGQAAATPVTLEWTPGTSHKVAFLPTHGDNYGRQEQFVKWSDGSTTNSRTLIAPAAAQTYTGIFQLVNLQ